MPLKEATFWFGITVFGTGLFGWMEGGERMPIAISFMILGLLATVYSVIAHYQPKLPKMPIWIGLLVVTWVVIGFDVYDRHHHAPLLDFDDPRNAPLVISYGMDSANSCVLTVNGGAPQLLSRESHYKIAVGCLIYDGTGDILDAPNLQVSKLYDIKEGVIGLRAIFSPEFAQLREATHSTGIDVTLLLIPDGVDNNQFSTLRQARKLNVRIVSLSMAGAVAVPMPVPTQIPH